MDMELERFKTEISLAEYAAAVGYEIDRRESSRSSIVMRRAEDKIIVSTDQDGHWIYFSVRDAADHGSIIDFVQRRNPGLNLGQVRKEFRPWLLSGTSFSYRPHQSEIEKPEPTTRDRQQVLAAWMLMRPAQAQGRHHYLENGRKLKPETLADPRFVSVVWTDGKGNAVFPHYDGQGLAGFELKNEGFTGFSRNGRKAVWGSGNLAHASRVVLVESAIDAMSHAQLCQDKDAAYLSTGGSMSNHQRELVRSVLVKTAGRGAEIVIATDNDEGGEKLAEELSRLVPAGLCRCRREIPSCKDWNDQLKGIHQAA